MDINVNIEGLDLAPGEVEALRPQAASALDQLWSGQMDMTGWVKAPIEQDEEELKYLLDVADIIRDEAELLLVLGIGGSYMGAKAAIEALPKFEHGIDVRFLGINFCTDYYREIIEEVKRKNTIVCIVSKSGNTMEIQAALEVIRPIMEEKYGSRRILLFIVIAVRIDDDEFDTAVHLVFSIAVDSNIEIVPAIVITGGIGILIHLVHRLEAHVLPNAVRNLG